MSPNQLRLSPLTCETNASSKQSGIQLSRQVSLGLTAEEAVELYESEISEFERREMMSYPMIYTIGS